MKKKSTTENWVWESTGPSGFCKTITHSFHAVVRRRFSQSRAQKQPFFSFSPNSSPSGPRSAIQKGLSGVFLEPLYAIKIKTECNAGFLKITVPEFPNFLLNSEPGSSYRKIVSVGEWGLGECRSPMVWNRGLLKKVLHSHIMFVRYEILFRNNTRTTAI